MDETMLAVFTFESNIHPIFAVDDGLNSYFIRLRSIVNIVLHSVINNSELDAIDISEHEAPLDEFLLTLFTFVCPKPSSLGFVHRGEQEREGEDDNRQDILHFFSYFLIVSLVLTACFISYIT